MTDRSVLCVIPARGGSKRLPRKNVVDFLGRPIIAHTIETALACGDLFRRVVVSTDDDEIAAVAQNYGAEVVPRPANLATDRAQVVDVCVDLLAQEKAQGRDYDILCCLYATAPLRNAEDIRKVVGLVEPGRSDFAIAVTHFNVHAHQALRLGADGSLHPLFPELANLRSQDVGELVGGNGSTYVATTAAFLAHRSFNVPGAKAHLMPWWRSVDIDRAEDLEFARLCAQVASRK